MSDDRYEYNPDDPFYQAFEVCSEGPSRCPFEGHGWLRGYEELKEAKWVHLLPPMPDSFEQDEP